MLKYEVVRRNPVLAFYFLSFFVSWSGGVALVMASHGFYELAAPFKTVLLVLFAIGPALSAIVVKQITCTNPLEPRLISSLLPTRHPWHLYAFALLFPLALILPMNLIDNFRPAIDQVDFVPQGLGVVTSSLIISCLANPCEEIGWRGFALPRLQKHFGENYAAIQVGVVTGIWHLPLFWMHDGAMSSFPFRYWLPGSIAVSFSLMWIYNQSGQSLFLSSLLHVSLNTWFNINGIRSFQSYSIISVVAIVAFVVANQYRQPKQLWAVGRRRCEKDDVPSDEHKSPIGREFES